MILLSRILLGTLIALLIAAAVLYLWLEFSDGPPPPVEVPRAAVIEESVLFPANDRVMTTYCTAGLARQSTCHLAAWDLDGGNVRVYATPPGQRWRDARFSPDGKEFVSS